MPSGVYIRKPSAKRDAAIAKNFAKGREKAAREKAAARIREIAKDPAWIERVRQGAYESWADPEIQQRYIAAMEQRTGYDFDPPPNPLGFKFTESLGISQKHIDRFWARVEIKGDDECWPYFGTGADEAKGKRGTFFDGENEYSCSRFLMTLIQGRQLSPAEHSCHHCDNPPCCNPRHLYLGDYVQNMADKMRRNRQSHRGHLRKGQAQIIRNLYARGWTRQELADAFGIKVRSLKRILDDRVWRKPCREQS